jgi:DNA mismatch repair protein MutS
MATYDAYFELTEKHRQEHGERTILLMQIGGFYEMYGLHDDNGVYIDKYSKFYDICVLSGLKMTDKDVDKKFGYYIAMAGFRTYSLEKYNRLFVEVGYVVVVYDQDEQKSGTTRSIQAIYTPGTLFDTEENTISNVIMCCWLHKYKNTIIIGSSCINILTGKSFIFEYERLYELSPDTFDELDRFVSTFSPNEILLVHNIPLLKNQRLIDLCNLSSSSRNCIVDIYDNATSNDIQIKRALNCTKQTYQDEIYGRFFNSKLTSQTTDMLVNYSIASQSYCFLLDYIHRNNPYLVSNIEQPLFENKSDRIVLGNHSLKQLNIIEQNPSKKTANRYSSSYVDSYSNETTRHKKRLNSVCDLLNYCKTGMGNRLFNYTMTHPHSNTNVLNTIYNTTEYCKTVMDVGRFNDIVCSLANICDIEKVVRKIHINRVSYDDVMHLYQTLRETENIISKIICNGTTDSNITPIDDIDNSTISKYIKTLSGVSTKYVRDFICQQKQILQSHFNDVILSCVSRDTEYTEQNIFKMSVYTSHDEKVIEYYRSFYQLKTIHYYLNEQLVEAEKQKSKSNSKKTYKKDPVKFNETEKGLLSFEITSARTATLSEHNSKILKNSNGVKDAMVCISGNDTHQKIIESGIIPDYLTDNIEFSKLCFAPVYMERELVFEKSASNGQRNITNKTISSILKNTQVKKEELINSIKTHFLLFINDFKSHIDKYDMLVKFCAHIDMLMCYTIIAKFTNYCRPVICESIQSHTSSSPSKYKRTKSQQDRATAPDNKDTNDCESFCEIVGLRHPLIENLLDNEIYVSNSITLNTKKNKDDFNDAQGFLLYGTNTVGKSSFIKSIGIAVIMAQCGFYVSAESMVYSPYKSIYTRILGNDNLFRGLSTFNVEMIELKNILNHADKNSLVIGDEVCSGTEMSSATSIFMSALENLYAKRAKFIFATHFHNVAECEEMNSLERLKHIHLSVRYDKEQDKLLYDRKLKKGAGENMYGLEVCKYLHLPDEFINRAYELRSKYFSNNSSLLDLKPSVYNANKLVGNCEKCGKRGTEVHHLQYQRNSDEKGYIKNNSLHHYFHKNKKANLMVLCDACHDIIHHNKNIKGHYRVSDEVIEIQ